jgi:hypothetical protein
MSFALEFHTERDSLLFILVSNYHRGAFASEPRRDCPPKTHRGSGYNRYLF